MSLEKAFTYLFTAAPTVAVAAVVVGGLWLADRLLLARAEKLDGEKRLARQIAMLVLSAFGLVLVVLSLPVADTTKGQLLSILGLVVTGVIGVSSTTFVSNAMAGLMLRAVGRLEPGDFVRVEKQFGRVTERGLFHTEIQTEDRDLVTLPNLFLITHPFRVIRSSGTIVTSTLSLGYDVPHATVESLFVRAAEAAGLADPFVQIISLGDFSVTYRAAGLLTDVKRLLTARSELNRRLLDELHGANVEIVSPNFMNQRVLPADEKILPDGGRSEARVRTASAAPESLIFDKAEAAGRIENMKREAEKIDNEIRELSERRKRAESSEDAAAIDAKIASARSRADWVATVIEAAEKTFSEKKD